MLLEWCTLEPSGSSRLAALRFNTPVRVKTIKIFPTGTQPFAQCPDVVARTEPASFYLDAYFNILPMTPADPTLRPKPTNELVHTALPYSGDRTEFSVDMSIEYATRFVIFQGSFQTVSLAIYGDLVAEQPSLPLTYHPNPLPIVEHTYLTDSLDPANAKDPTLLAKQLLELTPEFPSLAIVVRLMYCVKPSDADWENPDFPYLYVDLDQDMVDFSLEKAVKLTTEQISDELTSDQLTRFADKLSNAIGPPDSDQSYRLSCLLSNLAPQNPELVELILDKVDLSEIIEPSHLDKYTMSKLAQAATNVDIARHLDSEKFLDMVQDVRNIYVGDPDTSSDATKLLDRIQGWHALNDALVNPDGDFVAAAALLKDIGTHELAFGIWLESMIAHPNIFEHINHEIAVPLPHPPNLLQDPPVPTNHQDFLVFVKAYVGVALCIAVYAWSDGLPNARCRERVLSILRLWQTVDGYREIVNHFLLIPQMTFRLECMVHGDGPPTRAGMDAENIILNLVNEPHAFLSQDIIQCIFALDQPLSVITEDERLILRKLADIADGGLKCALEELASLPSLDLGNIQNLRILRCSLAVLESIIRNSDDGEWKVLESTWGGRTQGIVIHLGEVYSALVKHIRERFGLALPLSRSHSLTDQTFLSVNETLALFTRLASTYLPPTRVIRECTANTVDLFACTDAADTIFSRTDPVAAVARETRDACIYSLKALTNLDISIGSRHISEIIFRVILVHGLRGGEIDPIYRLHQTFTLVDHLIPFPDPEILGHDEYTVLWVQRVIPNVLTELRAFFTVLDVESRVHLIKRLVSVDDGVVGVGEWLVLESMKDFHNLIQSADEYPNGINILLHQIVLYLRLLEDLLSPSSSVSNWTLDLIESSPEMLSLLSSCFDWLLQHRYTAPHATDIAYRIASGRPDLDDATLITVISSTLLRTAQEIDLSVTDLVSNLCPIPDLLKKLSEERLAEMRPEVGAMAGALVPTLMVDLQLATVVVRILETATELSEGPVELAGLTGSHLSDLLENINPEIPPEKIDLLQSKVAPSFQHPAESTNLTQLPSALSYSFCEIHDIIHQVADAQPPPGTPPLKPQAQDGVIGMANISPSTILRSPLVTGLTKMYLKNDFRQLRQGNQTRQNTSRLPSMHVDDFEDVTTSPAPGTVQIPPMTGESSLPPKPVGASTDVYRNLGPAFMPQ